MTVKSPFDESRSIRGSVFSILACLGRLVAVYEGIRSTVRTPGEDGNCDGLLVKGRRMRS